MKSNTCKTIEIRSIAECDTFDKAMEALNTSEARFNKTEGGTPAELAAEISMGSAWNAVVAVIDMHTAAQVSAALKAIEIMKHL